LRFRNLARRCAAAVTLAAAVTADAGAALAQPATPDSMPRVSGPLTMRHALQLTAKYQSALRAGDVRAAAARDRIRAAGAWLNPELTATEENFGGALGSERREGTLEIAQTFELGGDRKARAATARAGFFLATAEAASLRLEALALTAERFIGAWTLQTRLARLRDGEDLTRQAIATASERYRAGATPVLERSRAEAQALAQGVERRRAEAELAIARRALALSWGGEASFDSLRADPVVDSLPRPQPGLHPALERASANEALAQSRVRAAEAARVPDLTVSGGLRRLEEAQATGFVASVALPLPLWNSGRTEVGATRQEYAAALADRRAVARRVEVELANAVERAQAAAAAYDSLRARVRPARAQLIDELLRAYRAGRIGYLDLIAEQRNLLETDLALVDAQADLWRARVELELLAGTMPRDAEDR
jgi:outer membrane protein, heavy metal efflux system